MGVCSQKKIPKGVRRQEKCAVDRPPEYKKIGVCGSMRSTKIGGGLKKNGVGMVFFLYWCYYLWLDFKYVFCTYHSASVFCDV